MTGTSAGRSDRKKFILQQIEVTTALAVSKTVVSPVERVTIILQTQDVSRTIAANRKYRGAMDVILRLPKEQGLLAFWRGNLPNLIRYVLTPPLTYYFHDNLSNAFKIKSNKDNFWTWFAGRVIFGSAAIAATGCLLYPLDYARTPIAADVGHGVGREFKGMMDCLVKATKSDGPFGVYRGFSAYVQGVIIQRAAFFGLFDASLHALSPDDKKTTFLESLVLAQMAAVVPNLLSYPWDTIQRRMSMQSGRKELLYNNSFDCAAKIVNNEGKLALLKGSLLSLSFSAMLVTAAKLKDAKII